MKMGHKLFICMSFLLQMTAQEYREQGFPEAEDFANFFEFEQRGIHQLDPGEIRRMVPDSELLSFEEFARQNKDNLLAMLQALD